MNGKMDGKMPPKMSKKEMMKMNGNHIPRIIKILFADYKPQLLLVAVCIVLTSLASTISSFFLNTFINYINEGLEFGLDAVSHKILIAI